MVNNDLIVRMLKPYIESHKATISEQDDLAELGEADLSCKGKDLLTSFGMSCKSKCDVNVFFISFLDFLVDVIASSDIDMHRLAIKSRDIVSEYLSYRGSLQVLTCLARGIYETTTQPDDKSEIAQSLIRLQAMAEDLDE